jgi:tRNA1(Val) A37 N6-methylase TrmN6
VHLLQPARGHGYRVNVDAILLAAFAGRGRAASLAVDLGAGVGAVALALAYFGFARRLILIEKDPLLVELARRNVALNGLSEHATVHAADVEKPIAESLPDLAGRADLVVANPPYTDPGRDRRAHALAKHGRLAPFLRAAADALGRRGRACFAYPAHELVDLSCEARRVGLEPKRMQLVHGREDRPARIALVELLHGKTGGLVVQPPLFETDAAGRPTAELRRLQRPPRTQ